MNTNQWTAEDKNLYEKWERLHEGAPEWYLGEGEWLRIVDEEGVLPTEVGEWQANRAEESAQG
jgi:hypothetical protein